MKYAHVCLVIVRNIPLHVSRIEDLKAEAHKIEEHFKKNPQEMIDSVKGNVSVAVAIYDESTPGRLDESPTMKLEFNPYD